MLFPALLVGDTRNVVLRTGRVLDADRPDLDLVAIVFQDDAVDLGAQLLSLVGFTEVEVHRPWSA